MQYKASLRLGLRVVRKSQVAMHAPTDICYTAHPRLVTASGYGGNDVDCRSGRVRGRADVKDRPRDRDARPVMPRRGPLGIGSCWAGGSFQVVTSLPCFLACSIWLREEMKKMRRHIW